MKKKDHKKTYDYDKIFEKYEVLKLSFNKPFLILANVFLGLIKKRTFSKIIKIQKQNIKSYDGKNINIYKYSLKSAKENDKCIAYFHGGGFVFKESFVQYNIIKKIIAETKRTVFSVDYRLAYKYPYPTPLYDSFASYKYIVNQLNYKNVIVMGDSAGGSLACGVSLLALDNNIMMPKLQVLVYPVVDPKMSTSSIKEYTNTPLWNSKLNKRMWEIYLKDVSEYKYALILENDLVGLPDTYIEVAEFDCLHDDGVNLHNQLLKAGVNCTLYETKKTVHGYDGDYKKPLIKEIINKRIEQIKKY